MWYELFALFLESFEKSVEPCVAAAFKIPNAFNV